MKIKETEIKKFQMGGAMAPAEQPMEAVPAEQPQEGGDPFEQIMQMAMEALQSQNCEAAMGVCQGLVQLAQEMAGGQGGAEQAPAEPVFKKGGQLGKK